MKNKKIDLSIKDLTTRLKTTELHPNLPRVPFSLICTAKSESGKSNLLINLILKYGKIFKNNTYIFNSTPDMSIKKNLIDNKKINGIRFKSFFDKKGNSILEAIYNQQREYFLNDEEPPHVLIYIDDMYDPIMTEKFSIFNSLYTNARHYNISIIQVSHTWFILDAFLRRLCKYFILFRITSAKEKKGVIEELCNSVNMNEKEFEIVLNHCTTKQYDFILIDSLKARFLHNLLEPTEALKKLEEYREELKRIEELKKQKLLKK